MVVTPKGRFDKLLEPGSIGGVKTRNRMIKTGADTGFSDGNSYVNERHLALYEALAKGGVGLINVETTIIDAPYTGSGPSTILHLHDDKFIPGFSELTKVIHKHGCPTFLLMTGRMMNRRRPLEGDRPSSKLPIELTPPIKYMLQTPQSPTMTIDEIEEFVDKYAMGAGRAQKSGFDGVEIHACSTTTLNCFLSRAGNTREDAYGCQSLESRSRIVVEIIRAIKKRVGQDFPVTVIINGAEYGLDKGTTSEESQGFARIFQAAGADGIHVRAWGYGSFSGERVHLPDQLFYPELPTPPTPTEVFDGSHHGAGFMVPLAAAIKQAVSIPVNTVGRLDPELGERILREGKADFIGLNRRLLADPELPNKIASGKLEDIAPCTACVNCFDRVVLEKTAECRINAFLGSDQAYVTKEALKKKKVLVAGGGPAGMEAARVAALRGHDVTLYEKGHKLGGLLPLAATVKGVEIEDLPDLVRYLSTQITKLGVTIRLSETVTPALIEKFKPDVVILATGGRPAVPEIPGINRRNVVSNAQLHRMLKVLLRFLSPKTLRWATNFWMPLGKRVVIIGGQLQGCELAEFLVKRGRKVTIVDTAEELGGGMASLPKLHLFEWLDKKGANMMVGVKYEEITSKGLTVITKEGKRLTIACDTIVPSVPMKPDTELFKTLNGKVPEIYQIGDCSEPGLTVDAIAGGSRVAHAI